jgi:hypothetical protein
MILRFWRGGQLWTSLGALLWSLRRRILSDFRVLLTEEQDWNRHPEIFRKPAELLGWRSPIGKPFIEERLIVAIVHCKAANVWLTVSPNVSHRDQTLPDPRPHSGEPRHTPPLLFSVDIKLMTTVR